MTTKSTRYLDQQGRVILPSHIRKALNLNPGNVVEVTLDEEGSIRIRRTSERCVVCGQSVENIHHTKVKVGTTGEKNVCYECAQTIARAMIAKYT